MSHRGSQPPTRSVAERLSVAAFSTAGLAADVRYDAWRQLMGTSHEIEADPASFAATVRSVQLDRMVLHTMDAAPQLVKRTAKRIRRDGLEHFVLHLSEFDGVAETPGGAVALKAGRISINDLTCPSLRAAMPERGSVILSLSRDLVADALGATDGLHGLVLDSEPGLLLASHVRLLAARADGISAEAAPNIARATALLLAASLADRPDRPRRAAWDGLAFVRAKTFIDHNLGQADLTPELIAAASALSRSSLFRMFRSAGGVSAYVQKRRLDRIRTCLANPADQRSVSTLAYAHGFNSLSHFSRAFRDRYGCTPSDMRQGGPLLATPRAAADQSSAFGTWVRELG